MFTERVRRFFGRLVGRLWGSLQSRLLGMTGRASRLDLDTGAARDFAPMASDAPASAAPVKRGHLTVISGGRSAANVQAIPAVRPQPWHRQTG